MEGHTQQARTQGEQRQQSEAKDAEERSAPGGKVVYRAILMEGEEELERSSAALFWSGLLAFAETARVWVIVIITYLVGLGEFSHVIAGSIEVFTLGATGDASRSSVLGGYVLPTLIGNILGGITLVAILNHAQITAGVTAMASQTRSTRDRDRMPSRTRRCRSDWKRRRMACRAVRWSQRYVCSIGSRTSWRPSACSSGGRSGLV